MSTFGKLYVVPPTKIFRYGFVPPVSYPKFTVTGSPIATLNPRGVQSPMKQLPGTATIHVPVKSTCSANAAIGRIRSNKKAQTAIFIVHSKLFFGGTAD